MWYYSKWLALAGSSTLNKNNWMGKESNNNNRYRLIMFLAYVTWAKMSITGVYHSHHLLVLCMQTVYIFSNFFSPRCGTKLVHQLIILESVLCNWYPVLSHICLLHVVMFPRIPRHMHTVTWPPFRMKGGTNLLLILLVDTASEALSHTTLYVES